MTDDNEQPAWNEVLTKAREVLARANATLEREFAENPALREQVATILKNAQALARDGLWPHTAPVPTFVYRLESELDASMAELMSADPPALKVFPPAATASGTAPSPGIRTSFTASGSLPAEPKRGFLTGLNPGQIYAIALIWVIAYALPIYLYSQSPTASTLIGADVATFAFAYEITCRILDKRK